MNLNHSLASKLEAIEKLHILYDLQAMQQKYVGQSAQTINGRFRQHESHIKTKQNPVAQHFANEDIDCQQYCIEILDKERDKNK